MIIKLKQEIVDQIAAGEIIQRPSFVLKELMENAIDAKATNIQVKIEKAGTKMIQVLDNGIGMSENDCTLCFQKHATSKIKTYNDLCNIRTLGFRGEALHAIASVSRTELISITEITALLSESSGTMSPEFFLQISIIRISGKKSASKFSNTKTNYHFPATPKR